MLKSSEFNSAVPKFTNGNYASTPLDPTNIEEPTMQDYVRGVEPLETLPAQWWNWLCNQFTSRFNKLNTYVKNIFDELTQLLSLVNVTPDGTESTITTGQLKNAFKELYPTYVSDKLELGTTYVKQTTTVNGHALSGNVTVSKSDVGLGNVPNVSTNDQTPTYTEASSLTALSSGEKLSIAFGKLAKAVSSLISHINNTSNPHSVTKAQVQLGNVVNTGDSATPVENGTTKFTTGGAYTELGKKLSGYSANYTVNTGEVPTNKYVLIFERTAPVNYYGLAFHIFGQFGHITSLEKQTFDIIVDFRNANYVVDLHAITDKKYYNFDVIATWDSNTNTARVYLEAKQGYVSANINAIGGNLKLPFTTSSSMLGTPSGYTFLSQATIVQTNVKNSLASNFSPTIAYAVGDYVLYDSLFYKCTTAHPAGSWNSSHFTAVTVGSEFALKADKSSLSNVVNTGDSATPVSGGTTKFTTGGAYNLLTSLAPIFSTSTSYAVGDMVTYSGKLYTCTTAHSAGVWNASDFTVANLNTEFQKPADNIAPNFDTEKAYIKGELVMYNKELYICKRSTYSPIPAWDSSYFEKTDLLNNEKKNPGFFTLETNANVNTVANIPVLPSGSELLIRLDNESGSAHIVTFKATKMYKLGLYNYQMSSLITMQVNDTFTVNVPANGYVELKVNYVEVDDTSGYINGSLLAFPLPTVK